MKEAFVPLCVPEIRGREWEYVKDCLDTGWVSSVGAYVDRFEGMVAAAAERRYGVAMCNGTSALHMALVVAGVRPGEEVLVSDVTFIAPANVVRYVGAHPVLVDAEEHVWQMDVGLVERFLRGCRREGKGWVNPVSGRRVAAILPVHALGHPVEIERLMEVAREFALPVIEDATESLGARVRGRAVGAHGDVACFSFNGNKILTTGGGGVLVTDREDWAKRVKHLTTQAKADPVEYVHDEVGYNYRLTNLQAAMGCAQMELLAEYVGAKRRVAERYRAELSGVTGVGFQGQVEGVEGNEWMFTVRIDAKEYGEDSRSLLGRLAARNVQARPLWQPMHLSPAHRESQVLGGGVAEVLSREGLSLPCSVGLTFEEHSRVIEVVRERGSKTLS